MFTEKELSYGAMESFIRKGARCGVCGAALIIAWGGAYGVDYYIMKCVSSIDHKTIQGVEIKDERQKEAEKTFKEAKRLNQQLIKRPDEMLKLFAPKTFPSSMTRVEQVRIAQIAIKYDLDPLMDEIMIYQGKPFITLAARLRKAQDTNLLDGVDTRPATDEEKLARKYAENDFVFVAQIWKKECSHPFVGWGIVREGETKGSAFLPIVNNPAQHAEKRAIARGLRLAFSIPLPSFEDIGGEEEEQPKAEVIEGEATVLEDKPVAEKSAKKAEPAQEGAAAAAIDPGFPPDIGRSDTRDPDTIKNLGELFTACFKDFGLDRSTCLKELDVNEVSEITDSPAECYQKIALTRS